MAKRSNGFNVHSAAIGACKCSLTFCCASWFIQNCRFLTKAVCLLVNPEFAELEVVDECPCLVVVRTFELPAYRIAAGIVVGVGTSYERILLNSNWFAGNDDSPSITCATATELGVGIVINKTSNGRVAPAIATSYDSITNIVLVEAVVTVIVTLPAATPVTVPSSATVAMVSSEDAQVKVASSRFCTSGRN